MRFSTYIGRKKLVSNRCCSRLSPLTDWCEHLSRLRFPLPIEKAHKKKQNIIIGAKQIQDIRPFQK